MSNSIHSKTRLMTAICLLWAVAVSTLAQPAVPLRPPAVPLSPTTRTSATTWSMSDNLADDRTKHWTRAFNSMVGVAGDIKRIITRELENLTCG